MSALAVPVFLASCAPPGRTDPTPANTPALATAAPTAAPASGPRPEVVASFGPNGTHWPAHTPWIGDDTIAVVEVDCTWEAIADALTAVTTAQAAAGLRISVAPGTLPGEGNSSGSTAMLEAVGDAAWSQNVLVAPRDGWGTVTIDSPARLLEVHGVTFARIDGDSILLTNCSRTAWAHAKLRTGFRMTSSYGATTTQCDAYEVVMADAKIDIADPLGYAAGEQSTLTDSVWEGCYCASVFRPIGASDHVDSLQMFGNGWYRGLTIRDSALFGSLNCALQIGGSRDDDPGRGTAFLTLEHSLITSQATAIGARYPLPDGAEAPELDQALNGIGEEGQLFATASYIFGSMYRSAWGTVVDTKVSYDGATDRNPIADGAWDYDPDLASWGSAEFDELAPAPTDQYLASIWS